VLMIVVVLARRRLRPPNVLAPELLGRAVEESPRVPSLSALRDQGAAVSHGLAKVTELFAQVNSSVNQFQTVVERYALSNYNELEEAEEQCIGLARECILLLDHLDLMIERCEKRGEPADLLRAARSRLCNLLEDGQIEEMSVSAGDVFNSAVQVATAAVSGSGPEGLVAGVSRKGYAMKVRGRDVTLRPAEVTVTSTHAKAQAGSGGPK
jgi:molecular chaperone GrpE (heat shock protein)